MTLDGAPLSTTESIGRPQSAVVSATPMALSDFVGRVELGLAEAGRR
jgi:hypothetical protein